MKQTKTCPKCGCTKILRVEDVFGDRGNNLILGFLNVALVNRYVCTECGYVEDWVDPMYMKEVRQKYEKEHK